MNRPAPQLECGCVPGVKKCPEAQELWNNVVKWMQLLTEDGEINLRVATNKFADHYIEHGYEPNLELGINLSGDTGSLQSKIDKFYKRRDGKT